MSTFTNLLYLSAAELIEMIYKANVAELVIMDSFTSAVLNVK